jgi:GntR family transcriptional regulator of arabinose operon
VEEIKLVHEGVIPLHSQLLNQLRHLILSGQWGPGTRMPSEPELQRQLNISRSTIRKALSNAETEGLITRVPGKGTFVAPLSPNRQGSHLLGYVTDDCHGGLQSQVFLGVERAAAAQGFRVIFVNSDGDVGKENRLLDQLMLEDRVAGILVWAALREEPSGRLFQLAQRGTIPIVAVDRTFEGLDCDFVTSQNHVGARAAVQHLLDLGHQRIAFLSRPILRLTTVAARVQGYQDALRDAGLMPWEPWLVGRANQELNMSAIIEGGQDAHNQDIAEITERLTAGPRPTAIFAVNDFMAIRAMKAARLLGLQVPEDLSLVGFDDIPLITSLLDVPLTTIAQDALTLGKRATELLIERIQGYSGAARQESLPTELRVRSSTALLAPPGGAGGATDVKLSR